MSRGGFPAGERSGGGGTNTRLKWVKNTEIGERCVKGKIPNLGAVRGFPSRAVGFFLGQRRGKKTI